MKRLMFGLVTCLTIVLAGCSSSSTSGTGGGGDGKGGGDARGGGGGDKLIGKWEMVKEIPELKSKVEITMEFVPGGKATMTTSMGGKAMPAQDATYKHEGDKLIISSKSKLSGKDETEEITIKKLTDTELTISDPKKGGEEMTFTRKK
jgi:uncharacterized protein (TIGR03066 family)